MKVQKGNFLSIEQLQEQYLRQTKQTAPRTQNGLSFQDILKEKQSGTVTEASDLRFSKHAAGRLADRNIELTSGQMERLEALYRMMNEARE